MSNRTIVRIAMACAALIGFAAGILVGVNLKQSSDAAKEEARKRSPAAATYEQPPQPPPTTDFEQLVPVLEVVDGDTADVTWVWHGEMTERLRFLCIDTPERGEPGYDEATAALAALIGDGPVRLEFENPGVPARGGYGRLLVYVFNSAGQNVNVEMIRQGWSAFYVKYGKGRPEYAAQMEAAEAEAKAAKVGIWAD